MSALFMTVVGVVGTQPRVGQFNGTPVLSFRMVATERRYDNLTQSWVDVHSSWMTVSCFRRLARNVAESIQKGDRLIVHGKVKVKNYLAESGQQRTAVDLEALSVGHDLTFGTARFQPALTPENADDRLRQEAEALAREQAELPQESVRELLAGRAAISPHPDDGLDDDLDDDLEDDLEDDRDDDEEGDRRTSTSRMAAVG